MIGKPPAALHCSACDTPLSHSEGIAGLCPSCLIQLALEDTSVEAEVLFEPEEAPTLQYSGATFEEGQIQGERYRVRSLLGRGGMGEVWRAYDLKLRQDVALKALRTDLLEDRDALETLRQEVRTAREVISPNVCRVFDLQEMDGQELVAMEYVDGTTLQEILRDQSPLELDQAREVASQFLAGLEAIHVAGLVHRDIKPENVMVTRTGRVVVMDFGLAKGLGDGKGGLIAGTPAYMAPEQSRGEELDARVDVFSAGVVLAEMVAPGGTRSFEDRQKVWEALHQTTPEIAETPWARVIARCVCGDREARYASAAELSRALEEVTLRAAGDETARPYPGLAAFQQEDARFFFGRELEVEALWKKLRRPHLLAVIGPSGAGKSSFLRAGLLPTLTDGWQAIITTPGNRPFVHLARVLTSELGDAPGVTDLLQHIEDPGVAVELLSEWRKRSQHALLIVDQFEELFTQNSEDVQERFAKLLGRLPIETDLFVLLSMRDDFLLHCQSFESLAPLFSELTPLGPPTGTALRRALVGPALKCGYRFEEEAIVEEMLAEVEGHRGALPLLAFAAAQLWERRDRESGLLTRRSYQQIGGVGGALAQHAEAILDYVGEANVPLVRELFRNLVTAQGTRAARDRDELLSVFDATGAPVSVASPDHAPRSPEAPAASAERETAPRVLDALIDARLLTSYEVQNEGERPHHRIEVVHESLLARWPRLVRWQIQDAEGAKLRDELRAQANLWEEHGRSEDYLWTGTAYREFQLWRERYPGGLTTAEEEYARAMTLQAERRNRRRRIAVTTFVALALLVAGVTAGLWLRSEAQARRAEASNLLAVAQLELETQPTATIAHAIASLELADDPKIRLLALEALWRGPTQFRIPGASGPYWIDFSPDGRWLASPGPFGATLWPADGSSPTVLENSKEAMEVRVSPTGNLIASTLGSERQAIGIWSHPEGRLLRTLALGNEGSTQFFKFSADGERIITATEIYGDRDTEQLIRSWPVGGGEPRILTRLSLPRASQSILPDVDGTGSWIAWPDGRNVRVARLEEESLDLSSVTSVEHDRAVTCVVFDDKGVQLSTADEAGTIRIWSLREDSPKLIRALEEGGMTQLRFDPSGSLLASSEGFLWDLEAPPAAVPLRLGGGAYAVAFDPRGKWLTTGEFRALNLWPLGRSYPRVLPGHEGAVGVVRFTPDGSKLVSISEDGSVRLWQIDNDLGEQSRILYRTEGGMASPKRLTMSRDGSSVAIANRIGQVVVIPLDGGPARELLGFTDVITGLTVGPDGRHVVASAGSYLPKEAVVRLWDLTANETRVLDTGDGEPMRALEFTSEGQLWVGNESKIRRLDLAEGTPRIREEIELSSPEFASREVCDLDLDRRRALLFVEPDRLLIQDLHTFETLDLGPHYGWISWCSFDDTGQIVLSGAEGTIAVSPEMGGEPHLLMGHEGPALAHALSPDGHWIVSGGVDGTIRLWPKPDLSEAPLHTLPRDQLLAKLRSLTNLRAIEDSESPSGWKLEFGTFPGWEEVPTW